MNEKSEGFARRMIADWLREEAKEWPWTDTATPKDVLERLANDVDEDNVTTRFPTILKMIGTAFEMGRFAREHELESIE